MRLQAARARRPDSAWRSREPDGRESCSGEGRGRRSNTVYSTFEEEI